MTDKQYIEALEKIIAIAKRSTWSDLDAKAGLISEIKQTAEESIQAASQPPAVKGANDNHSKIEELKHEIRMTSEYQLAVDLKAESQTAAGDGKEARVQELEIVLYRLLKSFKQVATSDLDKKRAEDAEYVLNKDFDITRVLRSKDASDGRYEIAFAEWALRNTDGINHEEKWYYDNLWVTTAQLYDIFKQQNK